MINVADPLENLEQIPVSAVKQVVKLPGQIISGALQSLTSGKTNSSAVKRDPLTGLEIPSKQQYMQMQKRETKKKTSGLSMMRQAISSQAQKPPTLSRAKEMSVPVYIAGKPGFSHEKMVKRMQGIETEKHELPPAVSAVKQKFSTGERKHGVGG